MVDSVLELVPETIAPPSDLVEMPVADLLRQKAKLDGEGSLTQQVYRLLRQLIVNLYLVPNQFLPEKEVAAILEVSKTPVREAFIRLAEEGLVNIVPKIGTYVSPIDIKRAFKGYFIRESLESACAETIALKGAPEDTRAPDRDGRGHPGHPQGGEALAHVQHHQPGPAEDPRPVLTRPAKGERTMDIRYSTNQRDVKTYTTEELRREFLIENLFTANEVRAVYSHVDRVITLGAMPAGDRTPLEKGIDTWKTLGSKFFLEGRELGIINIGGPGTVEADGGKFRLEAREGLYLSMGTKSVLFSSEDPARPAKFYMASAPAHRPCPTTHIPFDKAIHRDLGAPETSNARTINQYIHPDVLETCQLSMGLTILKPGSVWNTMPTHTHERRMEVYLYFDIPKDNVVFHFMGEPEETRHIVMQNEQAVISPSWSIHSGCGTASYSFIWAMAGENKEFDDMDAFPTTSLR